MAIHRTQLKGVNKLNTITNGTIIYHGSPREIDILLPQPSWVISGEKAVFFGPKWMALSFLGSWRDEEITQGTINGIPYMKEMTPGIFNSTYSNGGWLYSSTYDKRFKFDTRLAPYEVYSKSQITFNTKVFIKNPLEEIKAAGVNLYFFDAE